MKYRLFIYYLKKFLETQQTGATATDMNMNGNVTDDYFNPPWLSSGQVIEFDDGSGSVLRIQPLRTHRDEAIYECTATNSVGEINTSAKLTVLEGKTWLPVCLPPCLTNLLHMPRVLAVLLLRMPSPSLSSPLLGSDSWRGFHVHVTLYYPYIRAGPHMYRQQIKHSYWLIPTCLFVFSFNHLDQLNPVRVLHSAAVPQGLSTQGLNQGPCFCYIVYIWLILVSYWNYASALNNYTWHTYVLSSGHPRELHLPIPVIDWWHCSPVLLYPLSLILLENN